MSEEEGKGTPATQLVTVAFSMKKFLLLKSQIDKSQLQPCEC